MIRTAVIGVGSMGRHHVRLYSKMAGVDFVGISDKNKKISDELAEKYGIKSYANYVDLLRADVDAVSIAVPTTMHCKIALDAIRHGVNVLVEKPIAESVGSGLRIIKAAEKKKVKLMVGHVERFNPIIPVIKEAIKDVKVISIDITRVGPIPPRIKDVGVVIDLGVHDIDLIRHITGSEFKSVHSLTSSSITKKEDTAILSFLMENGTLAHITTGWLTPYKVREIHVATKEKFIIGNFMSQKVTEYRMSEGSSYLVQELSVPFGEPLQLELDSFINCIKEDKKPPVTGYDGLRALEIALRCLKSSRSK